MQRVTVAVASPGDVEDARNIVPRVLARWNSANDSATLTPLMWEFASVPELGDHPQHILNEQIIERSDLLIAIFWSRLGTPTRTAASGTVEEIREFIERKGARRVMLYFCTKDLPYDINPAEFAKLQEFKTDMRSQGLYHEYRSTGDFERDVYGHLDQKVRALLTGQLPLPSAPKSQGRHHADPRLNESIDFGSTLPEMAERFAARMDEFEVIPGTGPNKYLALGAHVYDSVAATLDRFLAYAAGTIRYEDRTFVQSISSRLKRLAADYAEYTKKPFPQYWQEGREISRDLSGHIEHLRRTGRIV